MIVPIEKPGTPSELVHFGVKGMKWGVRRKREVSPERKAKREARAQKFVKKAATVQKQIDIHKSKGKQTFGQRLFNDRNERIFELEKTKARALKDAEAKRQGKLSRRQKQVIVGAAVVGLLIAGGAFAAYKNTNSGKTRQLINRGKFFLTGKKFGFKENPDLARQDLSPAFIKTLIMDDINPGYPNKKGTNLNCRRATFAYELRRRGYDVQATRTPDGHGQNAAGLLNVLDTKNKNISVEPEDILRRMAKDDLRDPATRHIKAFVKRNGSLRDFKQEEIWDERGIFSRLDKEPERSRGEVSVMYAFGGGHSMAYEVINGRAHIFDNQSGKYFSSMDDLQDELPLVAAGGFTRLDNMELDTHFLERWVKNAK